METSFFVYIVRCKDGTLYTGSTNNLKKRLAAHNAGEGAKYIRGRQPVTLVYTEQLSSWGMALRREREIKHLSRDRKLSLIAKGAKLANQELLAQREGAGLIAEDIQETACGAKAADFEVIRNEHGSGK